MAELAKKTDEKSEPVPKVAKPVEQPVVNAKAADKPVERKSNDDVPTPAKAVKAAGSEKKESAPVVKGVKHFRSAGAAGMTILVDGEERARFVPYFDTYKGDKVRVGYLATDDKDVIERLENDNTVESVSVSEFDKETSKLELAPVYSV